YTGGDVHGGCDRPGLSCSDCGQHSRDAGSNLHAGGQPVTSNVLGDVLNANEPFERALNPTMVLAIPSSNCSASGYLFSSRNRFDRTCTTKACQVGHDV